MPQTKAVVERGFSKMGQIMIKKRCLLDDNSFDLLMCISHNKENLTMKDTTQVMVFGLDFPKEESSVISCEYHRKNTTVETIIIFELHCIDHSYSIKNIQTISFGRYFLF